MAYLHLAAIWSKINAIQMDIFLLIISIILIILGLLGCFLPILPGPPLSYLALIILHFTRYAQYSPSLLLILGILTIVIQLMDYFVPVWGTKKFGGTKYGAWGSFIGLIAGLLFLPAIGPLGIITILGGPFLGAFLGEKIAGKDSNSATRAAFGSFIGFLAGTFMKLMCSCVITFYYIRELIN
jgi:uncharacterized protein